LLAALPVAFYVLMRAGAQPGADFLARQFGGTNAVILPLGLVHSLALVAGLYGVAVDVRMLLDAGPSTPRGSRAERSAAGRPLR
jgi:hypothetical protein